MIAPSFGEAFHDHSPKLQGSGDMHPKMSQVPLFKWSQLAKIAPTFSSKWRNEGEFTARGRDVALLPDSS